MLSQSVASIGRVKRPMSSYSLPSGGSSAPIAGTSGSNRPISPAPQAHLVRTASTVSTAHLLATGGAVSTNSSPRPLMAANSSSGALAGQSATREVAFVGPVNSSVGLTTVVGTFPDRIARLSSLSLEHVLDRQVLSPATLAGVARVATSVLNLELTLQRRPDPSGLKLEDVHPGATQYLRGDQRPQPLPTGTPEATPTFARAGLTQQTRTSTSSGQGKANAVVMPGGNARVCYITGYTATGNRTATGTVPHWGTVAVDSSVIPLGSKVYIQGLGVFHAEDTGGAVDGNHVDVFVNSTTEAYQLTGYRLVSFVPPPK